METYNGYIHSLQDALLLFEACHSRLLTLVDSRVTDHHSRSEMEGNVYIWEESSSEIKRWRDNLTWSASRYSGNFLVYRQVGRSGKGDKSPEKGGNMVKKTLTATSKRGERFHLVSYYTEEGKDRLQIPEKDPRLSGIVVGKDMYETEVMKRLRLQEDGKEDSSQHSSNSSSPTKVAMPVRKGSFHGVEERGQERSAIVERNSYPDINGVQSREPEFLVHSNWKPEVESKIPKAWILFK